MTRCPTCGALLTTGCDRCPACGSLTLGVRPLAVTAGAEVAALVPAATAALSAVTGAALSVAWTPWAGLLAFLLGTFLLLALVRA